MTGADVDTNAAAKVVALGNDNAEVECPFCPFALDRRAAAEGLSALEGMLLPADRLRESSGSKVVWFSMTPR